MRNEIINRIEILASGEFFIGIEGKGNAAYQYIYREAAGVYWEESLIGFKSTPMKEWTCRQWFKQIASVLRSGIGVQLVFGSQIEWLNIPDEDRLSIESEGLLN